MQDVSGLWADGVVGGDEDVGVGTVELDGADEGIEEGRGEGGEREEKCWVVAWRSSAGLAEILGYLVGKGNMVSKV